MKVKVIKILGKEWASKACSFTIDKEVDVKDMRRLYNSEHSPIRTQMFWIEMYDIPSFVSVHLTRHKFGVEHFVKSLRDDRCGDGTEDRNSPVNHAMMINAQALINMARKRLCAKSHEKTITVMNEIRHCMLEADPDIRYFLRPECRYRHECPEFKSCGYWESLNELE